MTPDSQFRIGFGALDGIIEGWTVGHQRRARQNSFAMATDDSLVDSARQAEIIRIEDRLLHVGRSASLSREKCYHGGNAKFWMTAVRVNRSFLARSEQFVRHQFGLLREKYERIVTVFNNSVENRVEKARK